MEEGRLRADLAEARQANSRDAEILAADLRDVEGRVDALLAFGRRAA
jgi:hypothetical protein